MAMSQPLRLFTLIYCIGSASAAADVGFTHLYEDSPLPVQWQCWSHAQLPSWLNGSFLLPSVGLFNFKGKEFQGLLDGFGKLHRFEMADGKICLTSKMMLSGFYNQSLSQGSVAPSMLFKETKPPRSCGLNPLCNVKGPNDNVYINSIKLGDHFLQLTDSPVALEVDLETLDIQGKWAWTDKIGHRLHMGVLGSAHPLRRPTSDGSLGEYVMLQTDAPEIGSLGGAWVDMVAVSNQSPHSRRLIGSIHSASTPYFHSYGVTENYAILGDLHCT